jgi:flagellar secretion chaperone FliS
VKSVGEVDLAYGNAAQAYRKNATLTASPAQLVVMLYDGALRFMEEGKRGLAAKDYELQNYKLQKAQKIVMELMGSLNFELGGEVSKNLLNLYTFVLDELVEGNMRDDSNRIDNAMRVMSELRESWVEIEKIARTNPAALQVKHAA